MVLPSGPAQLAGPDRSELNPLLVRTGPEFAAGRTLPCGGLTPPIALCRVLIRCGRQLLPSWPTSRAPTREHTDRFHLRAEEFAVFALMVKGEVWDPPAPWLAARCVQPGALGWMWFRTLADRRGRARQLRSLLAPRVVRRTS